MLVRCGDGGDDGSDDGGDDDGDDGKEFAAARCPASSLYTFKISRSETGDSIIG